ncbi:hypothetical protein [Streptomyces sp. UH6]|uniref:hypothetical protein n=1 Tax=Streptomyces sp. UH6 TaxID=2748379 RepID=UPI0015D48735|nr:hypothetical protein [Streptomyces sp. UH6]NYV73156.1 hypothetical protein [Streptomyces sp. UH6]
MTITPPAEETPADPDSPLTAEEPSEEQELPQNAWSARQDLFDHSPRSLKLGSHARFGGGMAGQDQHGVSGGQVTGDVIMGSKTEIHHWSRPATSNASGEVPQAALERLAASFVAPDGFETLLARLRDDRCLVLSGSRFTGRRTAALKLLHTLGASPVHLLDRDTDPKDLADRCAGLDDEARPARGFVLCDLATRRGNPLRESHLLAAAARLRQRNAYLVITVDRTAVLEEVPNSEWTPPAPHQVLTSRLHSLTGPGATARLLALPAVQEFLGRSHQLRETTEFAAVLALHASGEGDAGAVENFSLAMVEKQVGEWFADEENSLPLREKAFLIALAAFDGGPYALTAEVGDDLYRLLQRTENPSRTLDVPVFGMDAGKRLQAARAQQYEGEENTEWGQVVQRKAAFIDDRTAPVLLRELWSAHPSARPALIGWLRRLAEDGRALVRTRAAFTAAVLARADLPSAMALLIQPWASSRSARQRQAAVNALALAHMLGTPNIPRIFDQWSRNGDRHRRWVAVRGYALIGPERARQALSSLREAVRRLYGSLGAPDSFDLRSAQELVEAVELLIHSSAGEEVLDELVAHLDDDIAVRTLTLHGFLAACGHTEDDEPYGPPLLLGRYARAARKETPAARLIPLLWRRVLSDLSTTEEALDIMRTWVLAAAHSGETEWALAALLPRLVEVRTDAQRLSHLLRTMPGEDGAPPPKAADRLSSILPFH